MSDDRVTPKDVIANLRDVWVQFGPSVALSCLGAMLTPRPKKFVNMALKDIAFSPRHSGSRPARRRHQR
jgi:hypothetical protein